MNTSCENNNTQTTGCCMNGWQTMSNGCFNGNNFNMTSNSWMGANNGVMPVVLPTQVVARQAFNFVEQPVIMPIECRTINRQVMVPRVYPTYTHTSVNCCC